MRIADLRYREVINLCTGHRLGFVCDVEMEVSTGQIMALVVPGPCRFFGLFGKEDDYLIPFSAINRIGNDIILIEVQNEYQRGKRPKRGLI